MRRNFGEESVRPMDTRFSPVTASMPDDEAKADANCKESTLSIFGIETIGKQAI